MISFLVKIEVPPLGHFPPSVTAINHWSVAIATYKANHPDAEHRCESLDNVDPRKAVPGGRLDILVASPECTHHSNARGGKPRSDQSRASAFHVLRWAEALYIENILIENVPEFMDWGPLDKDGQPVARKKGKAFMAFINALKALDYKVDWRVINAADYGDPTIRKRLFIQARKKKRPVWLEPTHAPRELTDVFGNKRQAYTPARTIIDWGIHGDSSEKQWTLDHKLHLLQELEVQAPMSFPKDYQFTGTRAEQMAHILNISRALAYRLIQQGQIVSIKIGTAVRVRQSDLEESISRNLHGVN